MRCEEHKPGARVDIRHERGSNVAVGLIGMPAFSANQRPSNEKGENKKEWPRNVKMKQKFSIFTG